MQNIHSGLNNGQPPHIMIVDARFYPEYSDQLAAGAIKALEAAGATWLHFAVPGVFEIPAAIRYAIQAKELFQLRKRYDGYIALGCVIRGETSHYDIVCTESARGLMDLSLQYTLAIGNGIITVENDEQALERARVDKINYGGRAAEACLSMIALKKKFALYPRTTPAGGGLIE